MKKFIFNLKSRSDLAKPLITELNDIIKLKENECFKIINKNKSDVKIECDNLTMFDILAKSRIVDNIQIEIDKNKLAE